jgi:hypothetical protein
MCRHKIGQLRGDNGAHLIGIDSLFQKTPIITPKKQTVQRGDALKIPLSSRGLQLSSSTPGCRVSALSFFWEIDTTNGYFDIELNAMSAFSASYSRIYLCFTAGERIGVWNCHASRRHQDQKTASSTSIVCERTSSVCVIGSLSDKRIAAQLLPIEDSVFILTNRSYHDLSFELGWKRFRWAKISPHAQLNLSTLAIQLW